MRLNTIKVKTHHDYLFTPHWLRFSVCLFFVEVNLYCWILCCWLLYSVWPNKETPTQHLLWISIKRTVFEGMTRKSVEIHPRSALRNHFIALFFRSAIHDGRSDEIHLLQSASWVFTAALQTVYRLYEFNFHMCHSIACYKNHTVAETIRFIWKFLLSFRAEANITECRWRWRW